MANTRFDLDALTAIKDRGPRNEKIVSFLDGLGDGSPYLSDLYVDAGGVGGMVLVVIGERESEKNVSGAPPLMFRINIMRDQWGNLPVPGEKFEHRIPNKASYKAGPGDINNAKRMGIHDKKYITTLKFDIDEKGCILCPFQVAGNLLNTYGLHSESRKPITMKHEFSREPNKINPTDKKGAEKHIHYWRYQEITEEQYKALPTIKTENKTDKVNK